MNKLMLIWLLVMIKQSESIFFYVTINKMMTIPSRNYSVLQLKHDFTQLQTNLFDIVITFNLTQMMEQGQSNNIFDIFRAQQYQEFFKCFNQNNQFINQLYNENSPCREICDLRAVPTFQGSYIENSFNQTIGNNSYPNGNSYWIIDNTFYPCSYGAYQPELGLSQFINISIEQNKLYASIIKFIIVVLLQTGIISLTYLIISFKRYQRLRTEFEKKKNMQEAQEILDSFIHKDEEPSYRNTDL